MATKGKVQSFTSKGRGVSYPVGKGLGIQAGVLTDDNRLIKNPKVSTDSQLLRGSRVQVTNPAAVGLAGKRSRGLGMGQSGSQQY